MTFIHAARGSHDVKVGDWITIERGRGKSVCQVVWTADPDSALRGQFTLECVEGSRVPGTKSCGEWRSTISRSAHLDAIERPRRMRSAEANKTGDEDRAFRWKGKSIWQSSADAPVAKAAWNRFPNAAASSAPAICPRPALA